jgi:hypothetical protein
MNKNLAAMLRISRSLEQRHATSFDQLTATDGTDAFACLRLYANGVGVEVEDSGNAVADGVHVIGQLGSLGVDHTIEVDNSPTAFGDLERDFGEHLGRVAVAVGWVGVWEHLANVGQRGRAEQRVRHGVQQRVGIAVADELVVVRHVDAAQTQRPAWFRAMAVFTNSDPQT